MDLSTLKLPNKNINIAYYRHVLKSHAEVVTLGFKGVRWHVFTFLVELFSRKYYLGIVCFKMI